MKIMKLSFIHLHTYFDGFYHCQGCTALAVKLYDNEYEFFEFLLREANSVNMPSYLKFVKLIKL